MLLTIELNGELFPLLAPVGAAAYTVIADEKEASIIFSMIQKEETGIATLLRTRAQYEHLKWKPVATCPAQQRYLNGDKRGLIAFDFVKTPDGWAPKTDDLRVYLDAIMRQSSVSSKAPDTLYVGDARAKSLQETP